jgi:hypothetical protein
MMSDNESTFVYIPTQAAVEPKSQGIFVIERHGPLPADFRVYTLYGFFRPRPRIWKESPESVEWLFDATRKGEVANLHDPAVFATLSAENAVLIHALKRPTTVDPNLEPWEG